MVAANCGNMTVIGRGHECPSASAGDCVAILVPLARHLPRLTRPLIDLLHAARLPTVAPPHHRTTTH